MAGGVYGGWDHHLLIQLLQVCVGSVGRLVAHPSELLLLVLLQLVVAY